MGTATPARVTEDEVTRAIVKITYSVLPDERTTVCQVTLDNGFTLLGTSACVSKAECAASRGKGYAFANAREKVWAFLGFRAHEQLAGAASAGGARDFLMRVSSGAYRVVGSGDLTTLQVLDAQSLGLFHVDEATGLGFALLPWPLTTDKDKGREQALRAKENA